MLVDSNDSPVHAAPLDEPCHRADKCRYCRLRRAIEDVRRDLARVPSGAPILTAIGLAVPAVEAWSLCGKRPNVSERAWVQGMEEGRPPYTRSRLKEWTYGTDRPSLRLETDRAVAEMQRVVQDLDLLERRSPVGFGARRADLREWSSGETPR